MYLWGASGLLAARLPNLRALVQLPRRKAFQWTGIFFCCAAATAIAIWATLDILVPLVTALRSVLHALQIP